MKQNFLTHLSLLTRTENKMGTVTTGASQCQQTLHILSPCSLTLSIIYGGDLLFPKDISTERRGVAFFILYLFACIVCA